METAAANYFLICGPLVDDKSTYWDGPDNGWTSDINYAIKYSKSILTRPLPEGGTSILELTNKGEWVNCYLIMIPSPSGEEGGKIVYEKCPL